MNAEDIMRLLMRNYYYVMKLSDNFKALVQSCYISCIVLALAFVFEELAHTLLSILKVKQAEFLDNCAHHDQILALDVLCFSCKVNNINLGNLNAFREDVIFGNCIGVDENLCVGLAECQIIQRRLVHGDKYVGFFHNRAADLLISGLTVLDSAVCFAAAH